MRMGGCGWDDGWVRGGRWGGSEGWGMCEGVRVVQSWACMTSDTSEWGSTAVVLS